MDKSHKRVIAYRPDVAIALRDPIAAIFYLQLWYWMTKTRRADGFVYKTKDEIFKETGLTRERQDTARKNLVKMGVIAAKLKRANGHATLHFKVTVSPDLLVSGIYAQHVSIPLSIDSVNPAN